MDKLPNNVVREIYKHLDDKTLLISSGINTFIKDKICNDIFWINKIQTLSNKLTLTRTDINLCKRQTNYKQFYFYLSRIIVNEEDFDELVIKFSTYGNTDMVRLILNMADLEYIDKYMLEDALCEACEYNHLETANVLLEYGVNPIVLGGLDYQPIMLATENANYDMVKLLLAKVNINHDQYDGVVTAASSLAFSNGRLNISSLLV